MSRRSYLLISSLAFVAAAATGCGGSSPETVDAPPPDAVASTPDGAQPDGPTGLQTVFGGVRPATLTVPSTYDPSRPTPLVIALHGYYTDPDYILPIFKLTRLAEAKGVLFIAPDGLANPTGNHYWNATDACCDLYDAGTDDVGYLTGLVAEIQGVYNVDPKRIYLLGHSNGAFMSLRLACEHADLFAAVISIAGANDFDPAHCVPSQPVSILQIHGDADMTIRYAGGSTTKHDGRMVQYPSATATVDLWAQRDGCAAATESDAALDLESVTPGDETQRLRHTGCPEGVGAELWTMVGVGHLPLVTDQAPDLWWSWLDSHARR